MGYSTALYRTVAELIEMPRAEGQEGPLRDLDDFVIALSLDSGLKMESVRARLLHEMSSEGRLFFAQRSREKTASARPQFLA